VARGIFSFRFFSGVAGSGGRVKNFPEHQSVRGGGHAGDAAVAAGQDGGRFRQRNFALADLDEGAHDAAAHFIKKAVAFDDEGELRAGFTDVATGECAHVGGHFVGARASEAAKIVFADEQFGSGPHFGHVEFHGEMPGALVQQRIHGGMVPDEVTVLLADGVKTGVKVFRGAHGGEDADVVRQEGVEREREAGDGHLEFRRGDLDVGDHAEGMHTGIRAAGTVDTFHAGKHFAERGLDFFLHANAACLHLPTLIGGAVVGDDEFEFQHFHGRGLKGSEDVQIALQQNGGGHFIHFLFTFIAADVALDQYAVGHGGGEPFVP
jgi:hypothetical protein